MLAGRIGTENIVVRGARVLDPVGGVDTTLDVRIDNGVIAQLGENLDTNEHRVIEAAGLTLAPAFIDPHVHLRTPGREDEETIESGTAAAAAGESATRASISTPRFIGPGCMTRWPSPTRSGVIPQRAVYSRSDGTKFAPSSIRSRCMRST